MSAPSASHVGAVRDKLLSMLSIAFGRLLPTLLPPPVDLTGKVAIITGGNSGIGLEVGIGLAKQGATVYLASRNVSKTEEAVSEIVTKVPASKGRVKSLTLDTSSFASVRAFAKNWDSLDTKIDILFHNAGTGSGGQDFSPEGFPVLYATNFVGSFLLTYLLESHLSEDARVILTSSTAHYGGAFSSDFSLKSIKEDYEPGYHIPAALAKAGVVPPDGANYVQTKGMQVAFAKLLQEHFDRKAAEAGTPSRRIAHAFSPGFVATPIYGKLEETGFSEDPLFWILRMTNTVLAVSARQGASTGVWLACTKDNAVAGKGMGGAYWDRMNRRLSNVDMMSKDNLERFWVRWEADAGVEWR
ncbi:MAG: hypothetical protein ASARMPREDX12_000646 [Alectoria sarmentosa]|nr:MAG: hypothetical protein ASARMPREDX12_000646 [Alectoria sarmentosa]